MSRYFDEQVERVVFNQPPAFENEFLVVLTRGFRLVINRDTDEIQVREKTAGGGEDFPLIGEINLDVWDYNLTETGYQRHYYNDTNGPGRHAKGPNGKHRKN